MTEIIVLLRKVYDKDIIFNNFISILNFIDFDYTNDDLILIFKFNINPYYHFKNNDDKYIFNDITYNNNEDINYENIFKINFSLLYLFNKQKTLYDFFKTFDNDDKEIITKNNNIDFYNPSYGQINILRFFFINKYDINSKYKLLLYKYQDYYNYENFMTDFIKILKEIYYYNLGFNKEQYDKEFEVKNKDNIIIQNNENQQSINIEEDKLIQELLKEIKKLNNNKDIVDAIANIKKEILELNNNI